MIEVKTRFVILSAARSGSTALTVTIGTHPKIYCHGSPFFSSPKWASALHAEAEAAVDLSKRTTDPVGLVYDVLNFTSGPPIVGCKLWHNADAGPTEAINAVAADPDIKKIILNRENMLACMSSGELMKMRLQHPDRFVDGAPRALLDFDTAAFLRFAKRRMGWFDDYRARSTGDVIEVPYINLLTDGIDSLRPFLKLHPYRFRQRTEKVNSGDVLARYKPAHHPAVLAALDTLGHPEWVREDHTKQLPVTLEPRPK